VFVKICGITSEDDALLAVALGADALGFVFAPSPRQVTASRVYDITRRLPPEILTVGVFRDELPDRVIDITQRAGLKAAQLHGRESRNQVEQVNKYVHWVIKSVEAGSAAAMNADNLGTDMVLVDASEPGSGKLFDWSLLADMPEVPRLMLAGGLNPDNVGLAIETVRPWGVDVSSGVEAEPGRKDPIKLRAFIKNAKDAAPKEYRGPDSVPYDWRDDGDL
jgi:phosphoribosylanthranilate isomerase